MVKEREVCCMLRCYCWVGLAWRPTVIAAVQDSPKLVSSNMFDKMVLIMSVYGMGRVIFDSNLMNLNAFINPMKFGSNKNRIIQR